MENSRLLLIYVKGGTRLWLTSSSSKLIVPLHRLLSKHCELRMWACYEPDSRWKIETLETVPHD